MRLTLGSRAYDLTTRALVLGTVGGAADEGADLVEVADPQRSPLFAMAADEASLRHALAGGADLVRLTHPTAAHYDACLAAGVSVVVPGGETAAVAAGLPADRVLSDALLVDVVGARCPLAATVAGVLRGARLVRTDDVRGARRVCDVLAAIAEADLR